MGFSTKLGQQVGSGVDLQMPPQIFWGPPQICGAKHQIFDHFFSLLLPLTLHICGTKRFIDKQ